MSSSDLFDSGVGKGWSLNNKDEPFPDPFMDYASTVMPENIRDALRFCEFIFNTNSMVREAARRIVAYFITDIDVTGVGTKELGSSEKDKYLSFLNDGLKIKSILHTVGLDFLCYGNTFSSLIPPFKRYLSCPRCFFEAPLSEIMSNKNYSFKWTMPEFHVVCPNPDCKYTGKWHRVDRRLTDEKLITVKNWSPFDMEIRYDLVTNRKDYIWRIPEDYRMQIRRGDPQVLANVPWEVVEAVKSNGFMLFDNDVVFHMSEPTMSGVRSRGWGISRTLVNFRQAWYCQVLHRYNEAIALDYVIPFRLLTPDVGGSGATEASDPILNLDLGGMRGEVNALLRKRRRDPASIHFLSHPIKYQMLGGEANQLAPHELLNQGIDTLLNGMGIPAELYKGTLSLQSMLPAIRLFQASFSYLVHYLNDFLSFVVSRTAVNMGWEPATAKLLPPTITDDMNNIMARLQLMQANQVSQTTGLRGMGLDFREETKQILQEEKYKQEQQAKMQEEMESAAMMDQLLVPPQQQMMMAAQQGAQGGTVDPSQAGAQQAPQAPTAPGAPQQGGAATMAAQGMNMAMPTGPNQKVTPQDMMAKAQEIASNMLSMPEAQRQSEMTKLKGQDPLVHSAVKQTIDNIRQQARTAGGQMVMQQQFGGGGQ
jgi:hypothetical protein